MKLDKWYFFLVAAVIVGVIAFSVGLTRGRSQARQWCIDKVHDNCEYICGVPRENFYYPDMESQEVDEYLDDNAIAWRLNYDEKSN